MTEARGDILRLNASHFISCLTTCLHAGHRRTRDLDLKSLHSVAKLLWRAGEVDHHAQLGR